jgi:glycogen operon protein
MSVASGDSGTTATLATRVCGSSDLFSGRQTRSVNFIAAHDGFTLADMVAYAVKHNEANGENNRDGHDENFSWNNGAEGPSQDTDVLARRDTDRRALLATLFASRGTIMLTAGDEFARTQLGNNNAYAQDNEITWIEWIARDRALEDFVAELASFRAGNPRLWEIDFLTEAGWFDLDGASLTAQSWLDAELAGFELHIPGSDGAIIIRIDRRNRTCTARRERADAHV